MAKYAKAAKAIAPSSIKGIPSLVAAPVNTEGAGWVADAFDLWKDDACKAVDEAVAFKGVNADGTLTGELIVPGKGTTEAGDVASGTV
ncbi:MAG: hypothetical protein M1821_003626 [Bathelium mastoideum]|nr:MAG: hypothetical protein M1821_003626 [Bathelium mastoideum]KAI9684914.1 MAG: hypothetical protein M1822_005563 [Bathelium mastoideum]